ncbi:MAG TPA: hypothetical protein VFB02_08395 [Bradyrhizobium sp.]|nr:hypothetical protein [Bradyrhizobium sp.]
MATIFDLKKDLPNWPLAILDDWLLYFANEPDLGWPPPEPLGTHRWSGILGGRPLSWWHHVTWKKESIDCSLNNLCEKSSTLTSATLSEVLTGKADKVEKRRYRMPMQYILEHGVFLNALVAMNTPSGLLVLDGYHRLAALHGLLQMSDAFFEKPNRIKPTTRQDAWIGTHRNGELPLT